MSNVIQFLESEGINPSSSFASYAASVAILDAGASQKRALLDRDDNTLNELLHSRRQLFCAIFAADED